MGKRRIPKNEIVPPFRQIMIHVTLQVLQVIIVCLQNVTFNKKRWKKSELESSKFISAPNPLRENDLSKTQTRDIGVTAVIRLD